MSSPSAGARFTAHAVAAATAIVAPLAIALYRGLYELGALALLALELAALYQPDAIVAAYGAVMVTTATLALVCEGRPMARSAALASAALGAACHAGMFGLVAVGGV